MMAFAPASALEFSISGQILARMSFRHMPPPTMGFVGLLVVGGVGVLVALGFLTRRLSRWAPKEQPLMPCYERLGRHAPGEACPCGAQEGGADWSYASCCRAKDVAALELAIREYLMQRWSHKSYAGRRWSRPMAQRLEDYPIPETIILPRWVRKPEDFAFPISEKLLRKWRPQQQNAPKDVEEEVADDLPL